MNSETNFKRCFANATLNGIPRQSVKILEPNTKMDSEGNEVQGRSSSLSKIDPSDLPHVHKNLDKRPQEKACPTPILNDNAVELDEERGSGHRDTENIRNYGAMNAGRVVVANDLFHNESNVYHLFHRDRKIVVDLSRHDLKLIDVYRYDAPHEPKVPQKGSSFVSSMANWFGSVAHRLRKLGRWISSRGSDAERRPMLDTSDLATTGNEKSHNLSAHGTTLDGKSGMKYLGRGKVGHIFDRYFPGVHTDIVDELYENYQLFLRDERMNLFWTLEQRGPADGKRNGGDLEASKKWNPIPILRKYFRNSLDVDFIMQTYHANFED